MSADEQPVTDEQLGAALRRLAVRCSPDFSEDWFQWYARCIVHFADVTEQKPDGTFRVKSIRAMVEPPHVVDGLVERLLEMVFHVPVWEGRE